MFLMPVFFAAAVALIAWAAFQTAPGHPANGAMDVARRRLASGEITSEEYRRIEGELGGPGSGSRPAPWLVAAIAFVLIAAAATMLCWMAWAGDWGWGWGQMGDMMRWRRDR
ncbi:MAG: hypothetical protein ACKVT1_08190 [Dehalococcoidia bacterium]